VRAQFSVQCSTSHAQEDAQVPAGPARVLRSAVGAFVVARYVAQQVLEHALIASLLAFRYCARHSVCVCSTRSLVVSCSGEARRGEARRVRLQAWAEQQGEKAVGEQQRQRFKEEDSAAEMR